MIATATPKRPIALSRLRAMPLRRVRGRFDSAATTEDNRRHWANADALSADAAGKSAQPASTSTPAYQAHHPDRL